MNGEIQHYFPALFPLFFALLWLGITTVLPGLEGWFRLMAKFPNQKVQPTLRIGGQSGWMGLGVSLGSILMLSVCPSGLRIGMMRVFGPLCRDFFVPWESVSVSRKSSLFRQFARLDFGSPVVGTLNIPARVADRLALAAGERWPEIGPFKQETRRDLLRRLLAEWVANTCVVSIFVALGTLAFASGGGLPLVLLPIPILFYAIVLGVIMVVRFFTEKG